MKILDRYVLYSFLISYFICFFALIGIFIIIDVLERAADYSDYTSIAQKEGQHISLLQLLCSYYSCYIPLIFYEMAPIITLMAAMFTVTRMSKANELIPIKACGVAMSRLFAPLFAMAGLISLIMMADQELLVPSLVQRLKHFQIIRDADKTNVLPAVQRADSAGNLFYIQRYYTILRFASGLRIIQKYKTPPRQIRMVIEARRGVWHQQNGQRGLLLTGGKYFCYSQHEGYLLPGYPRKIPSKGLFLPTDLTHEKLVLPDAKEYDFLATSTLWSMLKHQSNHELWLVFYTRFSLPLANVILLLLGLPLVLQQGSRHIFIGIGLCALLSGTFYLTNILCLNLGFKQFLHPLAAAWLPIILFGSLGVALFDLINQ